MPSTLTLQEISTAVGPLGWRFVLGEVASVVAVESLHQAAEVAARAVAVPDAAGHLTLDLRPDRVLLALRDAGAGTVTTADLTLAGQVSAALGALGLHTVPSLDGPGDGAVQRLEIAIDALDIDRIRPFWRAVLAYRDLPDGSLADPAGQAPAVWFQQMDAPRPQRNRIHLDVSVPHDEAPHRVEAALAAGGTLRSDAEAPSFWVLADAEGNEACVSTWQGRDPA